MAEPLIPGQGGSFSFGDLAGTPLGEPDVASQLLALEGPPDGEGTREGELIPGVGPSMLLLTESESEELADDLCRLLGEYDSMMRDWWDREDEIEDAYALRPTAGEFGDYQGAARMVSEKMMSSVDQSKARIARGLLEVEPLMQVTPIEGTTFKGELAVQAAKAAEAFLENYGKREMRMESILPIAVHRLCKLGTAVLRVEWRDRVESSYMDTSDGFRVPVEKRNAGVHLSMIRNRDAVVWPAWIHDWQEEYEVVGHRASYTISQWRVKARELGVSRELSEEIERRAKGVGDDAIEQALEREKIHTTHITGSEGMVRITELWCNRVLPGREQPERFQVILHEELRKILWVDENRLDCQRHPYHPLRYKLTDNFGWGYGIGHEVLMSQRADTAFRNLEIDNLMSSAFGMVLLRMGTMADATMDRPHPGMRVATEDPTGDVEVKSLASSGPLELLYQAIAANEARATAASGMASVLQGQGDPVMKSGAGTGAVLALVEQAGKKFGDVDAQVRADLSRVYEFILELVAQYAPDGLYYLHAPEEDAGVLTLFRYVPPRGSVADLFKITAQAPSAATNREMLKQNMLLIYNFMMQHVQLLQSFAQQIYPAENPAGYIPFLHRVADFMNHVAERVTELHDVPGLVGRMPDIDPPTPPEQIINMLQEQLMQCQTYAQALTAGQALPSGPAGPAPPGMGEPPPDPSQGSQPAGPSFPGGIVRGHGLDRSRRE